MKECLIKNSLNEDECKNNLLVAVCKTLVNRDPMHILISKRPIIRTIYCYKIFITFCENGYNFKIKTAVAL